MADKSDIEIWEEDHVRNVGYDRFFLINNITDDEAGVAGGVEEYLRRIDHERADLKKDARKRLDALLHTVLNIMRADSNLDYTDEADPNKWPLDDLTRTTKFFKKTRKRVKGTGQGVEGADQFITVEKISKETGHGSDYVVSNNPPNSDGEKNTNDARPGWWYRQVFHEANRDTVLMVQKFWKPEEVKEEANLLRLGDVETNPRRKRVLDIIAKAQAKFRPDEVPDSEDVAKRHEAIKASLESGLTIAATAHKHNVHVSTVSYVKKKFGMVPVK